MITTELCSEFTVLVGPLSQTVVGDPVVPAMENEVSN